MSDPETAPTTTDEPQEMRPIPDGGLRQSMPEWLRRPPAWRNLPKKDDPGATAVVESPPEATDAAPATSEVRLPEPDTSEIDPRSLVDIADLPQWLQDIAARASAPPASPVMTSSPASNEEADMTEPEKRLEREPGEERVVPFEPTDKKRWEVPEQETKVYGGGKPADNRSQMLLIGVGIAALVVLLVLAFMMF